MSLKQIEKYRSKLYSNIPLLRLLIRRRAAGRLARNAFQGNVRATGYLIEALLSHKDSKVKETARLCLSRLQYAATINSLCRAWESCRSPVLEELLLSGGYTASHPKRLEIITSLKLGRVETVKATGETSLPHLIAALCDPDLVISGHARQALSDLQDPSALESLCERLMAEDHEELVQIAKQAQYAPNGEPKRALFYFITGQFEAYELLDFQNHRPLLREGYARAPKKVKERFLETARRSGRSVLAAQALMGSGRRLKAKEMGYGEWKSIADGLQREEKWEEIWRLVFLAPVSLSANMLHKLKAVNWSPPREERKLMQELLELAPEKGRVFPPLRGEPASAITNLAAALEELCASPNGKFLAGAVGDTIRVWTLPEGKHLRTLHGHKWSVTCLGISPDSSILASGSKDRTVRFWSLPGGKHIKTLAEHKEWVTALRFLDHGTVLASTSKDSTVKLWSFPSGILLKTLSLPPLKKDVSWIFCLAASKQGDMIATGSKDSTVRLWSLQEGRHIKTLEGHRGGVLCVAFSAAGKTLASGDKEGMVKLWDLPEGKHRTTLGKHREDVQCLSITQNGELLASAGKDGAIHMWHLPEGKYHKSLAGHTGGITRICTTPDESTLASASSDKTIRLWSLPEGDHLKTLTGHEGQVLSLAVTPDGGLLGSGGNDKALRLWHLQWTKPLSLSGHDDLSYVKGVIRKEELPEEQLRRWRFLEALLQAKFRYDITIEEKVVSVGPFDIEIEG